MQKSTSSSDRKSGSHSRANSHSHSGLHSGVISKRIKREVRETAPILSELWDQSAPKIARFYRSYWRPVALATAGVAVVAFGAYYTLSMNRRPVKRFLRMAR